MRSLVIERLASQRREAFYSTIDIALNHGNQLVVFFREGATDESMSTFSNFFHLRITSPRRKECRIKHEMSISSIKEKKSVRYQLILQLKKFPPIEKGDTVTLSSSVPPNKTWEMSFTL